MAVDNYVEKSLLDYHYSLYCEEEEESGITFIDEGRRYGDFPSVMPFLEHDLVWDDEQLQTLFDKEKQSFVQIEETEFCDDALTLARAEAMEWLLKMNAHLGFSASTAILSVNYLDRFLSSLSFQRDKPWMMQLASVACLSLGAKVEETYVPLLLDLQLEGAKYVFEAKTIQRMELLVLSSLKWRMNPVTPLSFVDHIIRRLELKGGFFRSCEIILLSIISDSRFRRYPPSVLATATMLQVIQEAEPCEGREARKAQLLSVLKSISKEEANKCYQLISDKLSNTSCALNKRKFESISDNAPLDSWEGESSSISSESLLLPHLPVLKKRM